MSEQEFDAFAEWMNDVVEHNEREISSSRPLPDFAEVVARAHAEDPSRVSATKLEEARALAAVIPLQASRSGAEFGVPDEALGEFLSDVREVVEADVQERRLAAIPSAPGTERVSTAGRWRWAMAAAAVILLGIGVGLGSFGETLRGVQGPGDAKFQAPHSRVDADEGSERADVLQRSSSASARRSPKAEAPELVPELEPIEEAEPSQPVPTPDDPTAGEDDGDSARARAAAAAIAMKPEEAKPTLDDRLKALDEDAQERWRRGDLEGAEEVFRELIRRGGRRARVQLAYGDLFVLVRQARGAAGERDVWQEYLKRFPKGPHADDARAGLCRRAEDDARGACWERYLEDFPRGAHRARAARAVTPAGGAAQ